MLTPLSTRLSLLSRLKQYRNSLRTSAALATMMVVSQEALAFVDRYIVKINALKTHLVTIGLSLVALAVVWAIIEMLINANPNLKKMAWVGCVGIALMSVDLIINFILQ